MAKKKKEDLKYTESKWHDLKRYQCKLCPFDSLHEDTIREHIREVHEAPPLKEPLKVDLHDRFGNKIEHK